MVAGQERHRRLHDLLRGVGRGDEGQVDREGDTSTPSASTQRARASVEHGGGARPRRASPSVVHLLLDEAELDDGERDDDRHQHHRLRRRAAEVERLEAVVVDLVDEDPRCPCPAAFRRCVDDAEVSKKA
jgi:hypothetical protein